MPILDRALSLMDERKEQYTDYTNQIFNIEQFIAEELQKYDLKEFDFEYGREIDIATEDYPKQLKEFLASAYKEIREIDRKRRMLYSPLDDDPMVDDTDLDY